MEHDYYPTGPSVPEGSSSRGRRVQPCMVRFRCPICKYEVIEDIWGGPVSCEIKRGPRKHRETWMEPLTIVRDVIDNGYHPDSSARKEKLSGQTDPRPSADESS